MKVVSQIEGIAFVHFDDRDVVRHKLVQQIVKAYEKFSNGNGAQRALVLIAPTMSDDADTRRLRVALTDAARPPRPRRRRSPPGCAASRRPAPAAP